MPTVSIIFPSFNGEKFLTRNLDSIKKLSNLDELELIIVDNNSYDRTKEIIKSYSKILKISFIERNKNIGFAKACNLGASYAKGEFLFMTNQDMIFIPNFFDSLLEIYKKYKKNEEIILSPAIIFEDDGIHYFGAKIHMLGFSYTPDVGKELPSKNVIKKTQRFSGGSLFLKRNLFLQMGGFDGTFFMYYEDTDLSLRAIRRGIEIYTTNFPYIIHQKHNWKLSNIRYYLLERNRFLFLFKNISNYKKLYPLIIILEFLMLFQAILIKKFNLRIRIYYELLNKSQLINNLRKKSEREVLLYPYQKLNRTLDPFLIGEFQHITFFKKILNIFNKLLKFI